MHIVTNEIEILIKGCQQFNPVAQKQLYLFCYTDMMKVCLRYTQNRDDAAAIYNDAMLKVLQQINQYAGNGAFLGWVRRIVANTCIDYCRKQARYKETSFELNEAASLIVTSEWETQVSAQQVLQWLQNLPRNTALVFNMYCLEGYTIAEISTQLNITIGTAKWHVNEARKKLRAQLEHFNLEKNKINAKSI